MNHINLARSPDIILVAPPANIMAKLANGLADDLASTILLASFENNSGTFNEPCYVE